MGGFLRYQYNSYIRSLKVIAPLTIFVGWVIIFYTYGGVPVLSSYAITCIAITYPIVLGNFREPITFIYLGLALYSHLFSSIFGILVGSLFSITTLGGKKDSILGAALVNVISIAYDGIVNISIWFKWLLIIFPPFAQLIKLLNDDGNYDGLVSTIICSLLYTIVGLILVIRMYLRKEQ